MHNAAGGISCCDVLPGSAGYAHRLSQLVSRVNFADHIARYNGNLAHVLLHHATLRQEALYRGTSTWRPRPYREG
jgi:hypothetical protein